MELFEKSTRQQLRFDTGRMLVTTEDLWTLPLTSLNEVAKGISKQIKESAEENFIAVKSNANTKLELALDVVKHIIAIKLEEAAAAKTLKEKKEKQQKILELISQKKDEALGAKTVEELEKELAELAV